MLSLSKFYVYVELFIFFAVKIVVSIVVFSTFVCADEVHYTFVQNKPTCVKYGCFVTSYGKKQLMFSDNNGDKNTGVTLGHSIVRLFEGRAGVSHILSSSLTENTSIVATSGLLYSLLKDLREYDGLNLHSSNIGLGVFREIEFITKVVTGYNNSGFDVLIGDNRLFEIGPNGIAVIGSKATIKDNITVYIGILGGVARGSLFGIEELGGNYQYYSFIQDIDNQYSIIGVGGVSADVMFEHDSIFIKAGVNLGLVIWHSIRNPINRRDLGVLLDVDTGLPARYLTFYFFVSNAQARDLNIVDNVDVEEHTNFISINFLDVPEYLYEFSNDVLFNYDTRAHSFKKKSNCLFLLDNSVQEATPNTKGLLKCIGSVAITDLNFMQEYISPGSFLMIYFVGVKRWKLHYKYGNNLYAGIVSDFYFITRNGYDEVDGTMDFLYPDDGVYRPYLPAFQGSENLRKFFALFSSQVFIDYRGGFDFIFGGDVLFNEEIYRSSIYISFFLIFGVEFLASQKLMSSRSEFRWAKIIDNVPINVSTVPGLAQIRFGGDVALTYSNKSYGFVVYLRYSPKISGTGVAHRVVLEFEY